MNPEQVYLSLEEAQLSQYRPDQLGLTVPNCLIERMDEGHLFPLFHSFQDPLTGGKL